MAASDDDSRHLYHSPNRPAWLGVLSDIRRQADTDVRFVGNSPHTFTVEVDDPLPESVLDSLELDEVDEVPEA